MYEERNEDADTGRRRSARKASHADRQRVARPPRSSSRQACVTSSTRAGSRNSSSNEAASSLQDTSSSFSLSTSAAPGDQDVRRARASGCLVSGFSVVKPSAGRSASRAASVWSASRAARAASTSLSRAAGSSSAGNDTLGRWTRFVVMVFVAWRPRQVLVSH